MVQFVCCQLWIMNWVYRAGIIKEHQSLDPKYLYSNEILKSNDLNQITNLNMMLK
jgi:hypothetical protein